MHHEDFKARRRVARPALSRQQHRDRREAQDSGDEHLEKGCRATLKKFKGTAWDQSPLFKKIYEEEYGTPGGEPYGCLVGDYYFDHSPPDVEMLLSMSQICAASHTPFIAAARRR